MDYQTQKAYFSEEKNVEHSKIKPLYFKAVLIFKTFTYDFKIL